MADLDGLDEMLAALRARVERVRAATPAALGRAALVVEGRAKLLLSTTSHPPGTPTPSAPGEPPSLITGSLRRSITVDGPDRRGANRWEARVGPTIIYGRIQELGGTAGRGAHLPARPYMAPALDVSRDRIQDILAAAWRDALNG